MRLICPVHVEERCPHNCAALAEFRRLNKDYWKFWRDRDAMPWTDRRFCRHCGQPIVGKTGYVHFCSRGCYAAAWRAVKMLAGTHHFEGARGVFVRVAAA